MTGDEAIVEVRATVRDQASKLGRLKDVADFDAYPVALKRGHAFYSQFRPRVISQILSCGANGRIPVSSIAEFDEGFISLMMIEYPITESGSPNELDSSDWRLDVDGAVRVIRFTQTIPAAGDQVRIVHAVPHQVPADLDNPLTMADSDAPAVVNWSAAECLQMLADEYAQASEHTVAQADIATFINKSGIYSSRAAEMKKQFFLHLRAGRVRARADVPLVRG